MGTIIKRIFFAALLYSAAITGASAAVINSLSGVVVEGVEYNAYFHAGKSYNEIWNGPGSLLNRDPMFLNNRNVARSAAFKIANLMGPQDETEPGQDKIMVPFALDGIYVFGFVDTEAAPFDDIFTVGSTNIASAQGPFNHPFVSFELANMEVPVPAAFYLFASALAGLGLIAKKRNFVASA